MNSFEFLNAGSPADANRLMKSGGASAKLIAGGTDLLSEVKQGVISPARLVSVLGIDELRGITVTDEGIRIGAATTLAEIQAHPHIAAAYAALAQAAASVATPQIRNAGTLGGNLCQRPRCWYYRSSLFNCRKHGGNECFAHNGASKFHAIFGGAICPSVHPSDTAVALTSLGAYVAIASADGERLLPIDEFFSAPEVDPTAENVLRDGEVLTAVVIPKPPPHIRSIYLKAKERQAMDFALSSVALAVDVPDGSVSSVRITLGGVAPIPHRAHHAEDELMGSALGDVDAARIGNLAVRDAMPLRHNAYKVRLTSGLVARAVRTVLNIRTQETAS